MAVSIPETALATRHADRLGSRCGPPRMNIGRQFVILAIAALLISGAGCEKKKPRLPKQAKAPLDVIYTPLPPEITQAAPPVAAPPPQPEKEAKIEEPKPQPSKRRKPRKQPPTTTAQAPSASPPPPSNTVASAHPPAPEPDVAIAPDVTSAQLLRQKQTTAQLLESAEKALSGLSQRLAHDQEEMVSQIRSYVAQSRKATTEGDFERAYNLANKARLLSDALVKQ